jgi:hypothetical protein
MVITQAALGLRIAELLALRVEDVDVLHDCDWHGVPPRALRITHFGQAVRAAGPPPVRPAIINVTTTPRCCWLRVSPWSQWPSD